MKLDLGFSNARIPYGAWATTYFPAWQSSPFAEVHIGQLAGEACALFLHKRKIKMDEIDYMVIGSTVPWHYKFWTAPLVSRLMGKGVPGFHLEQACATGLKALIAGMSQVEYGASECVAVLTFDRTSDSPAGVFPIRREHRRTMVISDVWDNFGFDPATTKAMITTAGNAARKYKLDRREVDEICAYRYEQYFEARRKGFIERYAIPVEVLSVSGSPLGVVDNDIGVRNFTLSMIRSLPELDTCVTSAGQTHASDGVGFILTTTKEKAKELSTKPEVEIRFIAQSEVKTLPSLMPEAPTMAVQRLLEKTSLSLDSIAVIKNHNPFAVNDAIFSKVMGFDYRKMNNNGCPMVYGHPQGPTLTRVMIEAFEEAYDIGGGLVLIFGCAAGDIGIAGLFEVSEGGRQ